MALHLQRDMDQLKNEILHLGNLVEAAINNAILALTERRDELAKKVLENCEEVDQREVMIEEDCLKILALHQPVAADLRFIVVVLKVNNDLERMGDFAEHLATRALFLNSQQELPEVPAFNDELPSLIQKMVRNALDSLVKLDVELAKEVIELDDRVDAINRNMYDEMETLMRENPDYIKRAIQTLSCSRNLERVADLATNIAEDVIFMVEGDVVRHQDVI